MRNSMSLGGAFIGVMAGVGFASGQEILQFFASYGWNGLVGVIIATVLMSFFVMNLYTIGSKLQTSSHQEAIHYICGPKLGSVVDIILTFFLFGIIVIMIAGAGSSAQQQLGISAYFASAIAAVITVLLVFLGLKRVMAILSWVTPILALMIFIIALYAFTHIQRPFSDLIQIVQTQPQASHHWLLSALLYVSYNIAGLTAMLVVMGGRIKNLNDAKLGGILGGLGVGILIAMMTLVLIASADQTQHVDIPTLFLGNALAPWFGNFVLVFLQIKLIFTCMGLAYALAARCEAYGLNFKGAIIVCMIMAYIASQFGFVSLVSYVYPTMGYLGFILMICISIAWFRSKKLSLSQEPEESLMVQK